MKFEIGDKVRYISDKGAVPKGACGTIQKIEKDDVYHVPYVVRLDNKVGKGYCYYAAEKELEAAHESINEPEEKKMDMENIQRWKIVIVSTGDKTTAKLYALGRVIREVSVTRYYKDDYSTEVAAKEAVRKLFQPQGFNGRAMFVGNPGLYSDGFTYGKIYEFKNGFCVDNNDDKRPATGYPTTLEIGNWGSGDFIKVVE